MRVAHQTLQDVAPEVAYQRIRNKPALNAYYRQIYGLYQKALEQTTCTGGLVVEIGSGLGFAKEIIPEIIETDTDSSVLSVRPGLTPVDATQMPFADGSVRALFLHNVLHHIPDVDKFFQECTRCLIPGGRVLIVDQYPGWIARWVLQYLHHEPFDLKAKNWSLIDNGKSAPANGALAWLVFYRDLDIFSKKYVGLKILRREKMFPLLYWLAGGLKAWSLIPRWALGFVVWGEAVMGRWFPGLASVAVISIQKD